MINFATVFPGQGSQFIGMLAELADSYSLVKELFSLVSDKVDYDLWKLVQEGPEEKLNQTEHTQVAMLTADVAVFKLMQQLGLGRPRAMAGHSLGEYAALVCANALSLPDAAQLVAKRGELMQSKIPLGHGAMAAIVGLTDEQVELICNQVTNTSQQVTPANYNAIGQIVIAGHTQAVENAVKLAEEAGARLAKIIPVSVPCHCPLLLDVAEEFEEHLALINFKTPEVPVLSNVDLSIYKSPEQIRILLKEQLYCPVRWVETVQKLNNYDIELVVESGPGKVLNGLIKRIERGLPVVSVNDKASLNQALSQLIVDEVVS